MLTTSIRYKDAAWERRKILFLVSKTLEKRYSEEDAEKQRLQKLEERREERQRKRNEKALKQRRAVIVNEAKSTGSSGLQLPQKFLRKRLSCSYFGDKRFCQTWCWGLRGKPCGSWGKGGSGGA